MRGLSEGGERKVAWLRRADSFSMFCSQQGGVSEERSACGLVAVAQSAERFHARHPAAIHSIECEPMKKTGTGIDHSYAQKFCTLY